MHTNRRSLSRIDLYFFLAIPIDKLDSLLTPEVGASLIYSFRTIDTLADLPPIRSRNPFTLPLLLVDLVGLDSIIRLHADSSTDEDYESLDCFFFKASFLPSRSTRYATRFCIDENNMCSGMNLSIGFSRIFWKASIKASESPACT